MQTLKKKKKKTKMMTEEEEEDEEMEEMSTTTIFPQEIIIEILSWLPAKSLLTIFKFVCKPWCTIIKDPDFIKMHLNRGAINGGYNNESIVRKGKTANAIFQLHPPLNCEGLPISGAKKMDIDWNLVILKSKLVGSCNGLLCLSVNVYESIILLNPSTKKCKGSPNEPIVRPDGWFLSSPVTYGFGCTSTCNSTGGTIDEYKVVRIVHFYPNTRNIYEAFQFQIDIYSMSSNSWRRVTGIPCEISLRQSGVFLNGAFHWMGGKRQPGYVWDTIVSFNIRDEEFGQIPCADIVVDSDVEYPYLNQYTILMNVRGCLGNVYFSRTEMMDIELEIWVMKEYGIKESWTKEFVIRSSDSDPPRELFESPIYSRSMTCFLTGDQILISGRVYFADKVHHQLYNALRPQMKGRGYPSGYERRVLYDMSKKKIDGDFRTFDIPCAPWDDQVDYIETLVSLKSSLLPLSNNRKRKDMESLKILDTPVKWNSFFSPCGV